MGARACVSCRRELPDEAVACPYCGELQPQYEVPVQSPPAWQQTPSSPHPMAQPAAVGPAPPQPVDAPRQWPWVLAVLAAAGIGAIVGVTGSHLMTPRSVTTCDDGRCPSVEAGEGTTLAIAGTDSAADRVRIELPPAALASVGSVELGAKVSPSPVDLAEVRHPRVGTMELAGPTITLEPHGVTFDADVHVTLPLDPEGSWRDVAPELVGVLVEQPEASMPRWEVIRADAVDAERGLVHVSLRHFSSLTPIVDHDALGGLELLGDVYEWGDIGMAPVDCDRLLKVANQRGYDIDFDAFFESVGLDGYNAYGQWYNMAVYLDVEDGGENPLPVLSTFSSHGFVGWEPLRTGHEVELYEAIKRHILAKDGKMLTSLELLDMGLEAVDDDRNLIEAMVTVHNVLRALARPQQWAGEMMLLGGVHCPPDNINCGGIPNNGYGHPPTDPMTPIFHDLLGYGGDETLAAQLGKIRVVDGTKRINSTYIMGLFDPRSGVFESMPGATDAMNNAGSHYYFWVGGIGYMTVGPWLTNAGVGKEKHVKEAGKTGVPGQGNIQGHNALAGLALAKCLQHGPQAERPPLRPVAPPQISPWARGEEREAEPVCPALTHHVRKCPWSPDGYHVGECPEGHCYEAGPRGVLACVQEKVPANAKRNSWSNVECLAGFRPESFPCSNVINHCAKE